MSVSIQLGLLDVEVDVRPEYQPTKRHITLPDVPKQPAPRAEEAVEPVRGPLLRVERGRQAGAVFALPPGTTTVGRGRDADIVLDDSTVSRRHTELRRTGQRVVLRDAGSLNGTYLNGHPCDEATLTDGDHIWIGTFRLVFWDR
ncbi:FHA domain-containing protein [Gandjariella thermophila]|uniref:Phosphopeptide-binding protein n=1 Tax=Gandjariella thermophila TaxID=1931992 RepID=A0A4D4JFU1_9PSEU|nr:FHA domain-containing protein [Gandjariella thermophila]GDY32743.1 phosphopeptide-binding protein [Gandjariella thermophila]